MELESADLTANCSALSSVRALPQDCQSWLAIEHCGKLGLIFLSFFGTLGLSAFLLLCRIHGNRNVVWLLVRVETPRTRVVLDLVSYDACAPRGFCSEFLLLLTRLEPSWAVPIRGALRHSVFWHLGFWEWMGAAAVFGFFCATVFLTSPIERRQRLSTS